MRKYYLALLAIINFFTCIGQEYPYEIDKYPFINGSKNKIVYYDTAVYEKLFEKITDIGFKGQNKVSIVHIGDSHIQADFLSGNFRKKLQTFFVGAMGGRGFVFPYTMAKTNNPRNYKVQSTGKWESCRNVQKQLVCDIGLAGITVFTADSAATVTIKIDDKSLPGYDFDKLMVFHDFSTESYQPKIKNAIKATPNKKLGYTLFEFSENISQAQLTLIKTSTAQNKFNLYGFNFDSSDAGIIYHTIGVNGAEFESYLKCKYFEPHLAALRADWIIISLGTNDTYTNVFDKALFKSRVDSVIQSIKNAAPNAAILLTTPADHRYKKSYLNENVLEASEIIKAKANDYSLSYWDFQAIMGGEGSINQWYYHGMAHTDYLHFTKKGYEYQSQLLFNAFLKAYDAYLENEILNK